MDTELKRKWIEALRSGKYEQGADLLRSGDNKYCCLGVLCELVGESWEFIKARRAYVIDHDGAIPCYGMPPDRVTDDAGLRGHALKLSSMNDGGKSFAEIADYIEANL